MHIHLDIVGGVSGDMFSGALLDLDPSKEVLIKELPSLLGLDSDASLSREDRGDGVLNGSGLSVKLTSAPSDHNHTHFGTIRDMINRSGLSQPVKDRALDIFLRLAKAEGHVHSIEIEKVDFHEVGALDSILDITAAAILIDAFGASSWSMSPIPIGSGRINSQHGVLPVPAPATLLLLAGMDVFDDGVPGERITPTGAAILAHLSPEGGMPSRPMNLTASGMGFGERKLDGVPNILRAMSLSPHHDWQKEQMLKLAFEVDDQTPEDLAAGIEALRHTDGVIDVMSSNTIGKKGRHAFSVQVLCDPIKENDALRACFAQTTTLGIRSQFVGRHILKRHQVTVDGVGVKLANRSGTLTAKAEFDDINRLSDDSASRSRLASRSRDAALAQEGVTS